MALSILVCVTIILGLLFVVNAQRNDQSCGMTSKVDSLETAIMSLQRMMLCQAGELKCDYPSDLESRLAYLEAVANQVRGLQSGVNYKRWGRTSCPFGSEIIYKGYAAKNAYTSRGGGSNFICLPEDPENPPNYHSGIQGNSYIHGTEYLANGIPDIMDNNDNYNDMPCSVCETISRGQVLMIPAKNTCPSGWSKEYSGYLMAERSISNQIGQSDYICVDQDFEFINGGRTPQIRAQAMFVEVGCGILPCPPYTDGNELACVVCSK